MKIHNITIVGAVVGCGAIALSALRWLVLWPDISQAIFGMGIGAMILGGSYLYNWMKMNEEQFDKINKRLDAFTDWWVKQEV